MNYSLLVMDSAGMMKMATGDGIPPPAGCREGLPRGFWWLQRLVAVELPIYLLRERSTLVDARGAHETGGRPPKGGGAPSYLVGSLEIS